ncbi:hypothetical protein GGR57DRAFT_505516 [Xylariaceae sp. FL1272]|nr:hypothetical protein GGR57DRAFT_505516 [Xylariaceae sp. FL1272]
MDLDPDRARLVRMSKFVSKDGSTRLPGDLVVIYTPNSSDGHFMHANLLVKYSKRFAMTLARVPAIRTYRLVKHASDATVRIFKDWLYAQVSLDIPPLSGCTPTSRLLECWLFGTRIRCEGFSQFIEIHLNRNWSQFDLDAVTAFWDHGTFEPEFHDLLVDLYTRRLAIENEEERAWRIESIPRSALMSVTARLYTVLEELTDVADKGLKEVAETTTKPRRREKQKEHSRNLTGWLTEGTTHFDV